MYKVGQRVVCIDDEFAPWVYDLFTALPKKDKVYTVRAVGVGRSNPKFVVNDDAEIQMSSAEFDIMILLEGLNNPNDPHSSVEQELGFRSERFAPLQELEEEEEIYEFVSVGAAKEDRGW